MSTHKSNFRCNIDSLSDRLLSAADKAGLVSLTREESVMEGKDRPTVLTVHVVPGVDSFRACVSSYAHTERHDKHVCKNKCWWDKEKKERVEVR